MDALSSLLPAAPTDLFRGLDYAIDCGNRLDSVKRDTLLIYGEKQSDTAHMYNMRRIARILRPHIKAKLDWATVYEMIDDHDLVESLADDTSAATTENNHAAKLSQKEREQVAHDTLCAHLPAEEAQNFSRNWNAFEDQDTPEAKFVKVLDKLEVIASALVHPDINYWGRYGDGKVYYQIVLSGKLYPAIKDEPVVVEYYEHLRQRTIQKMVSAKLNPADFGYKPLQALAQV